MTDPHSHRSAANEHEPVLKKLRFTRDVMKAARKDGKSCLMSIWEQDLEGVEEAIKILESSSAAERFAVNEDVAGSTPASPATIPDVAQAEQVTPAAKWRANGEPDPHGKQYDCERARLAHGDMTDDEIANALFLKNYDIGIITAAKERIRWLSRALEAALAAQPPAAPVETLLEATQAQHVGRAKGEPAKFVRAGKLETCQCQECRDLRRSSAGTDAVCPTCNGPCKLSFGGAVSVRYDEDGKAHHRPTAVVDELTLRVAVAIASRRDAFKPGEKLAQSYLDDAREAVEVFRTQPQSVKVTDEVLRLRAAMDYACDLLAERTYGSSARSPEHNARLHLETALALTRPVSGGDQ